MSPRWWEVPGPGDEQAPAELEVCEDDDLDVDLGDADEECPDCLGHGYVCARWPDGEEVRGTERRCETCDGRGLVSWEREWVAVDAYDALDESALSAMEVAGE